MNPIIQSRRRKRSNTRWQVILGVRDADFALYCKYIQYIIYCLAQIWLLISSFAFLDNILHNTTKQYLGSYGFTEYFSARVNDSINLQDHMIPPKNSSFVFMGCGNFLTDIFDIGIILTPNELFELQEDLNNA